jgi:signal transduction histidine kinase
VAIIAINFKPRTLTQAAANNSKAFLESLITSGMVAIIFFGILYYMTVRPLDEMKFQIERVLRGRQKELASNSMFRELHPLRSTINSVLSRIRELQNTDSNETQELEEDGPYVRSLYEFMQGAQGAVMILNSEKIIQNINPLAEDLLGGGIRESSAAGTSVMESLKEQGLAVTIIELCDNSANNDGCNYSENYEINGKEISVNVASLIGKDKFAKAFYVTFVQR